jgi:hypothetical protein
MTATIDFKNFRHGASTFTRSSASGSEIRCAALIKARNSLGFPGATRRRHWLGADDAPQRRKDRRATSADRAWPPILANRPRSFGAMPVQRIAIKTKAPPSKAT